ncbi:hypothetical protein QYE76_012060 [Lolium multiflorum]|uniref:Uncharacterized protein n=1 Tax=Lolium multiflorum TaxID=4521 RepID=A0AAD8U018_LOLMU|nr:hypothetical protein QYE76_012060 [Lolium multiflorum]
MGAASFGWAWPAPMLSVRIAGLPDDSFKRLGLQQQGPLPPAPDLNSFPAAEEALRVTDEFCDQYRVLRREVEILQDENNRLRRMLERFLTPIRVVPPSPPKE